MGKAAVELAMSQPAVSKAMADLEHAVGVRLLDRGPAGVEPTFYGEALLRWGRIVFDDLRQGVKELEFLADPSAGEVRVGTTEPVAAGLVASVVERLSREYPRLVIHIVQSATVVLQYQDLRERKVDLVLGRMLNDVAEDDIELETLFPDPFRVVAHVNSPWARRRKASLTDLADASWSLPAREGWIGPAVIECLRGAGIDLAQRTVFSNSIQLHSALMASGRFLTVMSESTVRFGGQRMGLRMLPIDLPMTVRPVGFVVLKNRTLTPIAQLFMTHAREIANSGSTRALGSKSP
jgi:DNA-binding transcriptional LysR family regulator